MTFLLLETDQTLCYDASGHVAPCPGSGQDAARPRRISAGRFLTRDETVLDTLTGAVWTKNANPAEFPLTWEEARDFAAEMAALKIHGFDNWQLPSRRLLFSLISHQAITPALPVGHPFSNVFSGYCWTADPCHRLPDQVWHIHLGGGRVPKADKRDSALVWPVCPAPGAAAPASFPPGGRFRVVGGQALDLCTGLTWSRDADPAGGPLSWADALALTERLNSEGWQGAADWRMPNIRELESLADLTADSPALSAGHPFHNPREGYWSSTTSVYEPRYAWTLYTRDGMVGVGFKPDAEFSLWPVRGPL